MDLSNSINLRPVYDTCLAKTRRMRLKIWTIRYELEPVPQKIGFCRIITIIVWFRTEKDAENREQIVTVFHTRSRRCCAPLWGAV